MIPVEKWQRDLQVYQSVNSTFILEGNVHDQQPWVYEDDGTCDTFDLPSFLRRYLADEGYSVVALYNRIDGFYSVTGLTCEDSCAFEKNCSIDQATITVRTEMQNASQSTAIVLNLANTLCRSATNPSETEVENFSRLLLASQELVQAPSVKDGSPLNNHLFLIVDKVSDIPTWFYLNNPYVRTLNIPTPEKEARLALIKTRINCIQSVELLNTDEVERIEAEFSELTDGLSILELHGIISLCDQRGFTVNQLRQAIKLFRFGEVQSHWDKIEKRKITNIVEYLSAHVKGQKEAIKKASDVITRAVCGLTGIQGGSSTRPRGILFFAGPTGTGKTELAKKIAELVFGDESFLTRFDMSEYQQPHSDQKLLGAPPGYVGYSEGGQLTNAIKRKPFSVLLFDEIEKAHPSILDKFLQILEDGRITDSAGETAYLSECLIIFTSNLGVVHEDVLTHEKIQTITPEMSYSEIEEALLSAIKTYFKYTIQRPELLNRIGDNFVVFDFIRQEAAQQILELKVNTAKATLLQDKGIILQLSKPYQDFLQQKANTNFTDGGRGISNIVETYISNQIGYIMRNEGLIGDQFEVVLEAFNEETGTPKYSFAK